MINIKDFCDMEQFETDYVQLGESYGTCDSRCRC